TATEEDDVLLSTALGKSIRFPVLDVRVFSGRTSTGVRGIRLAPDDRVISLSILRHVEASPGEREAYFRRLKVDPDGTEIQEAEEGPSAPEAYLSEERFAGMAQLEQHNLTVASNGFGKRSSAYDYRITGRGGSGIVNFDLGRSPNAVVASFPV